MNVPLIITLPSLLLQLGLLLGFGVPHAATAAAYAVTCGRLEYQVRAGETLPVQVRINPLPPGGVYSFGVVLATDCKRRAKMVGPPQCGPIRRGLGDRSIGVMVAAQARRGGGVEPPQPGL